MAPTRAPDASPPRATSTVSMVLVRGLVEAVEKAGVTRDEFLRAAQLDSVQLDPTEARVPHRELQRLCELALDVTDDPALGLHWIEMHRAGSFAPLSHLIAHSPSLGEGLASLAQFGRLFSDEPGHELVVRDDEATIRCIAVVNESSRMRRFTSEMIVSGLFQVLRAFAVPACADWVSFEYSAPPYHAEYARVFDGTVRFEQPLTGIVFDRRFLDTPSPHKDEGIHEALRTLAERRLLSLERTAPYALRVRELLLRDKHPQRIAMAAVARSLGLSVRSLRRRLDLEGTSYGAVQNDALAITAKRLLRDEQFSVQETAYEMGFAGTSTFHRAFKRWTGTTPNAYREAQLGKGEPRHT